MVKLHRISLIESLTLESKKDLDDLKFYLGDDLFDSYMKIRDRISDPNFKDFSKLKKMDLKDIRDFVSSFQSKSDKKKKDKQEGAEKIYEDSDWVVYRITTYPAAQLYGKGTKWCITGRYPGHEERGETYFNDYIRDCHLDGGYYFFIDKEYPDVKYCLLLRDNGTVDSIWNAADSVLSDVDQSEAPMGLIDIADELPFGDELVDYLENVAGSEFGLEEALSNEINKSAENQDLNRIAELAQQYNETYDDNDNHLDPFYREAVENGDNDVFNILLRFYPPTERFFQNFSLEESDYEDFAHDIMSQPTFYVTEFEPSYFNQIFYDVMNTYGVDMSNYPSCHNPKFISFLVSHSEDLFDHFTFKDLFISLPVEVLSNREFLNTCFDNGLTSYDLINYTDSVTDHKKYMDIIKVAVDEGLIDLNDKFDTGSEPTYFQQILWDLHPSVEDVKWMLTKGADPDIEDNSGDTAIGYARDNAVEKLLSDLK